MLHNFCIFLSKNLRIAESKKFCTKKSTFSIHKTFERQKSTKRKIRDRRCKQGAGRQEGRSLLINKPQDISFLFMSSSIILTHSVTFYLFFFFSPMQLINMGFSSSVDTIYGASRQFPESLCQAGAEIEKVRYIKSPGFSPV